MEESPGDTGVEIFPTVDPSNVVKITFREDGEKWDAEVLKREPGDWYVVKEDGIRETWSWSREILMSSMQQAVELEYVVDGIRYRVCRVVGLPESVVKV